MIKKTTTKKEKKVKKKSEKKDIGKYKNRHQRARLQEIYDLYKFWKSLPAIWRGMKPEELEAKFSIDDPITVELLQIKTQSAFAIRFDIDIDTTTDWNKRMEDEGVDYLEEARKWANKLTKNVILAHYNKMIRKFDPVSGDIWYKTIAGFSEKKQIEHSGKLSLLDLAKEIDDEEQANIQKSDQKD